MLARIGRKMELQRRPEENTDDMLDTIAQGVFDYAGILEEKKDLLPRHISEVTATSPKLTETEEWEQFIESASNFISSREALYENVSEIKEKVDNLALAQLEGAASILYDGSKDILHTLDKAIPEEESKEDSSIYNMREHIIDLQICTNGLYRLIERISIRHRDI